MSLARAITTSPFSSTLRTLILQEIVATEAANMLLQQLKALHTADLWVAGARRRSTSSPSPVPEPELPKPSWRPAADLAHMTESLTIHPGQDYCW
jgi:hypothetical protein